MKWLLITTARRTPTTLGSNPGDEFARMGVELLINAVDPEARFAYLDKENPDDWNHTYKCDRTVVCGMPMFWANPSQTCNDIWWWDYLWDGAVSNPPKTVLCLGIGHVLVGPPADAERYAQAIAQVDRRAWGVTVREPVLGAPASWHQSICPSAFCMRVLPHAHTRNLCNLMPGGGHFGYLTPDGEAWDGGQARAISDVLRASNFTFVAHTKHEEDYAKSLGWSEANIRIYDTAAEYIQLYAKAACYFGNRLHAAAVCAATGAPVWALTHDSRTGMVARLGGHATRTAGVSPDDVKRWIESQKTPSRQAPDFSIDVQFNKMCKLLLRFMALS